ncbi:MAG: hypothetical protein RJA87_1664 [Pseudomonadota bacterium]|jgi:hypothetical protein
MALKTIREEKAGKALLRLVQTNSGFVAIAIEGGATTLRKDGASADEAWDALQMALPMAGPGGRPRAGPVGRPGIGSGWYGYDGARARFLEHFPGGFLSTDYVDRERTYKLKAKADLDRAAPLEAAVTGTGFGEAVLRAFQATDQLSLFERMRLKDMLLGTDGDPFIQAAARFTLGEGGSALRAMDVILRKYNNAHWTVVTYLPRLWRPDRHMFLKPAVTKDFAARVGHRLSQSYSADLNVAVYQDLLDMAAQIGQSVLDLEPRDLIDIHSLIWIVGKYGEE